MQNPGIELSRVESPTVGVETRTSYHQRQTETQQKPELSVEPITYIQYIQVHRVLIDLVPTVRRIVRRQRCLIVSLEGRVRRHAF